VNRQPRFEVVRSISGGWFARLVAANGQKVWQTEIYQRQRGAERAVTLMAEALGCGEVVLSSLRHIPGAGPHRWVTSDVGASVEVRYTDERGRLPAAPYKISSSSTFLIDQPTTSTTWNAP
jgi:uncharacterized protein YegP (UPF0339 family)